MKIQSRASLESAKVIDELNAIIGRIGRANSLYDIIDRTCSGTQGPIYLLSVALPQDKLMMSPAVIEKNTGDIILLEPLLLDRGAFSSIVVEIDDEIKTLCKRENIVPYLWSKQEKELGYTDPDDPTLIFLDKSYVESMVEDIKSMFVREISSYRDEEQAKLSGTGVAQSGNSTTLTPDSCTAEMRRTGGVLTVHANGGTYTGYVIEIVKDWSQQGKLRAQTNDGKNGVLWVQFPRGARIDGAVYVLPQHLVKHTDRGFYSVSSSLDCSPFRVK